MNVAAGDLVAVALIGSLAVGDYVPGRSDSDTAAILANSAGAEVDRELERLAANYAARYEIPKGFGSRADQD